MKTRLISKSIRALTNQQICVQLSCSDIMKQLIRDYAAQDKMICADDVYSAFINNGVDVVWMGRMVPAMIRIYKNAGLLEKTDKFVMSKRLGNASRPLPLYKPCLGNSQSTLPITAEFDSDAEVSRNGTV